MSKIFQYAPTEQNTGSPAYIKVLLDLFQQDQATGFIEILPASQPDHSILSLYQTGAQIANYLQERKTDLIRPLNKGEAETIWNVGEAEIRLLRLPPQCLRVVWMWLEWQPAQESLKLEAANVRSFVETMRGQRPDGLLYLVGQQSESMIPLLHGEIIPSDCIHVTPTDTLTGRAAWDEICKGGDQSYQGLFYSAQKNSISYRQQNLRIAANRYFKVILARYTHMVGRTLAASLAKDLNKAMQINSLQIEFFPDAINDLHIFTVLNKSAMVYRVIVQEIKAHIADVLGDRIASSLFGDTFNHMETYEREAIQEYQHLYNEIIKN